MLLVKLVQSRQLHHTVEYRNNTYGTSFKTGPIAILLLPCIASQLCINLNHVNQLGNMQVAVHVVIDLDHLFLQVSWDVYLASCFVSVGPNLYLQAVPFVYALKCPTGKINGMIQCRPEIHLVAPLWTCSIIIMFFDLYILIYIQLQAIYSTCPNNEITLISQKQDFPLNVADCNFLN